MSLSKVRTYLAGAMLAVVCLCAAVSNAQTSNKLTMMDGRQANKMVDEKYLRQNLGDSQEEEAYIAFHKVGNDQPDRKIKLGDAFLAKYPTGRHSEAVYEELAQTYYAKKDLASFYFYSDKGISLFPDDVHLLALTGWVIPRAFDRKDPDANRRLDKAESYEKHAIDVIDRMSKPEALTDQQFAEFKTGESAVAHSGLGIVYFRREQYETSAKELQEATATAAKPDPTDFYVLGADLENMGRFKDAVDAFSHCAELGGNMQDNCEKQAANAMKRVVDAK